MERKNEVKRSLDFRSSECCRNKILTDENKKRNECFYKENTMPKVSVISNPSKWRDFSFTGPQNVQSHVRDRMKTEMLSTYAILYRDG